VVQSASASYEIENRELVAETPSLRVLVLTLARGQRVPWHRHSNVTDTFFCLEGPMVVETRSPDARYELMAGDSCAVPPKTDHEVRGKDDGRCRFALVQGVGTYDFIPASD
jgi:quercetin dioxygenase-like cupin family protein